MSEITVLIPAYNAEITLSRAVRSAFTGGVSDIDVVIVNDASTDGTLQVANDLREEFPRNVIVVSRHENGRIAAALNDGAEYALGEYIIRLDADDWFERGALAVLLGYLDTRPEYTFAYGGRKYHGRRSDVYMPPPYSREALYLHNPVGYSYLFRREVLDRGILWEPLGETGGRIIDLEDWQHLLKMDAAGMTGVAVPIVSLNYNFRWDGTWQELRESGEWAINTLKAKFPVVKAVSI